MAPDGNVVLCFRRFFNFPSVFVDSLIPLVKRACKALNGLFWAYFGAILELFWAIFELFWSYFGPIWGI